MPPRCHSATWTSVRAHVEVNGTLLLQVHIGRSFTAAAETGYEIRKTVAAALHPQYVQATSANDVSDCIRWILAKSCLGVSCMRMRLCVQAYLSTPGSDC